MFRRLAAFVFLMAFVSQTFSPPFVLLDYYTNTAAYAKNCINKTRPKLHCNGKCQAMKKMREEEKNQQEKSARLVSLKPLVLSSKSFYPAVPVPVISAFAAVKKPTVNNLLPLPMVYSFFHPPQA
jgi:hypothetical protein